MRTLSRRSLLSGTGSVPAPGVAGCPDSSGPSEETEGKPDTKDETDTDAEEAFPDSLARSFEDVSDPDGDTAMVVIVHFGPESERMAPFGEVPAFVKADCTLGWGVPVREAVSDRSDGLVATGSISIGSSSR